MALPICELAAIRPRIGHELDVQSTTKGSPDREERLSALETTLTHPTLKLGSDSGVARDRSALSFAATNR
jgi:hypothetical protein